MVQGWAPNKHGAVRVEVIPTMPFCPASYAINGDTHPCGHDAKTPEIVEQYDITGVTKYAYLISVQKDHFKLS